MSKEYMCDNYDRLISDIIKEVKLINVSYEAYPHGQSLCVYSVKVPTRRYVFDPLFVGGIRYDTAEYDELLKLSIGQIKGF